MYSSTSSSVGFRPSVSVKAPLSSAARFRSSGTDLCLLTSETREREILNDDRVHSHLAQSQTQDIYQMSF